MTFLTSVPTYLCYIDFNNDGDFNDAGENVSDDFLSANIDRGFDSPLSRVSKTGTATLKLSNLNKQYSPPLAASMTPGRKVQIDMSDGTTAVPLYYGYIKTLHPTAGLLGQRQIEVQCEDALGILDKIDAIIPIQVNVTASQVINSITSYALNKNLAPATCYENGINTFPFGSDKWSEVENFGVGYQQVVASQKIQDACTSDWGRFFIGKSGSPCFINRHHFILSVVQTANVATLVINNEMTDMNYQITTDDIYNSVDVQAYPRNIGASNEVLGALSQDNGQMVNPSDTTSTVLNFVDSGNSAIKVAASTVILPLVATTDYVANTLPDGNGYDVTANASVSASGTDHLEQITLYVKNLGSDTPIYMTKLQVRGTPIRTSAPIKLTSESTSSSQTYQKRKLSISAPLMSVDADAQTLACYLVDVYKTPRDTVRNLNFIAIDNTTLLEAARTLELGNRLTITESQTGLTAMSGIVLGIKHNIQDQFTHTVSLDLETAFNPGTPFRLDFSQLSANGGHLLIY